MSLSFMEAEPQNTDWAKTSEELLYILKDILIWKYISYLVIFEPKTVLLQEKWQRQLCVLGFPQGFPGLRDWNPYLGGLLIKINLWSSYNTSGSRVNVLYLTVKKYHLYTIYTRDQYNYQWAMLKLE